MTEWILTVIILSGSGHGSYKYPSLKPTTLAECEKAAKTFQAKIPSGGDAEQGVAVICAKGGLDKAK
jgi:hypothetical protein